jgi:hypothetical protein
MIGLTIDVIAENELLCENIATKVKEMFDNYIIEEPIRIISLQHTEGVAEYSKNLVGLKLLGILKC